MQNYGPLVTNKTVPCLIVCVLVLMLSRRPRCPAAAKMNTLELGFGFLLNYLLVCLRFQDYPGPGSHDLGKSWEVRESGNTAFRHATGRTGRDGSLRPRPPPAMVYGEVTEEAGAGPGPGAYENHMLALIPG
jgi:hypothetical protein